MPLVLKDRVKETTTTTSTGSYTLAGAVGGYQAFSVIGNGNTTYYAVTNGTDWEVGIGTYTLSGTVLSRDTILESSNSGNAVNWSAGVKEIFCTYPAERSMYVDGTTITPAISARLGFTNLAQGSALSVLGVTGNATADNASIAAGTDNQVLRRSGTALAFGSVNLASSDAVTGDLPFANLAQIAGLSVLGVTGSSTADVAGITAGTDNQVLRRSGTSVAFGAVNLASTDAVTGDLPFSNLAQGSALSVLGVTGNATADNASIAAGTDHQVLRRSGTTVAFGAVNLAQSAAITGTLPVGNGGTGITSFGAGVATWLGTPSSANLAAAVTDETGSGALVFANTPTLVTPVLGAATGTSLALTGGSLTTRPAATQDGVVIAGRAGGTSTYNVTITPTTLTASRTLTLANGDTTLQAGTMAVTGTGLGQFASTTSSQLAGVISDETGSGSLVFATSPTLVTPVLGTPTSGNLSNCTVDGTDAVGFRNTPVNSQSAAYTLVLADAGKTILHPISDNNARTFTIPANSSVAYPVGTVITFVNLINTVTIAITSDTMYLAGDGSTGSRTLAAYGVASAVKVTSTSWVISGNGLS